MYRDAIGVVACRDAFGVVACHLEPALTILIYVYTTCPYAPCSQNPLLDDDDDAIYDAMKWRKETLKAVVLTIIVMFVGVPFFTLLLWLVSLPKRRYLKTTPKRDDDEETAMMNNRE